MIGNGFMGKSNSGYWKVNLAMMWLSQLMVMTGFSAAMPFIPLFFKNQIGIVDEGECGVYVSLFNFFGTLAYAVFLPIWGTLSDRFGVKIMLLRGTFVTALIFPLMGWVQSAWLLIALRFVTAACAGTTAASQTLIVKNTPEDKLGFALGVFSTGFWSGAMLGNVLGGLFVHYYGYESTFFFCGVLYFIAGIFVLFAREDFQAMAPQMLAQKKNRYSSSMMPVFTISVWLTLALFILNGFVRSFEIAYPAMLIEQIAGEKFAAYWTGIISAFASVGALISGALFGYLADRLTPWQLLLPALLFSGILLLVQAGAESIAGFGISRTLMCIAGGGLQPVFQKVLSTVTPKRKRGKVFGWASTCSGIGTMAASVAAGGVIYMTNTRGVFYAAALLTFLMIPMAYFMLKKIMEQPFYQINSRKK